jgi:hypothetical protein
MSRRARPREVENERPLLRTGWQIVFALAVIASVAIRIRLLGIPLERDEGEYAYAGQLLLQGIPPYQLAYNMKFPGVYAAYALILAIFGQTPAGVHLGLLLVNLATIALIFVIGRRLVDEMTGLAAASAYAILSVSPSVLGFAAHATHFVLLPVLAATLILLRSAEQRSLPMLWAGGAFLGLGLSMKQPGLAFVLFGGAYLFWTDFRAHLGWKSILTRSVVYLCGVGVPIAVMLWLLWQAGVFAKFWFWTIDYARAYGSLTSLDFGRQYLAHNFPRVVGEGWLLWALAAVGMTACIWHAKTRVRSIFLLGFLGFSTLALSAGLYFREHYFIFVLPALSLLVGTAVTSLTDLVPSRWNIARWAPLLIFFAALGLPLIGERDFFYFLSPDAASRKVYWLNPFPESIPIARFVRERTGPEDTIAVLGSEPQIYFYSHRHSATGYIYTYALMESHQYARQMQREMIAEIEKERPKILVFVSIPLSWIVRTGSDRTILDWINAYTQTNYTGVGLVNLFPNKPSEYYLPLESAPPVISPYRILVYERNR